MSNLIFIKDNDNNVGIGSNMINDIKGNINISGAKNSCLPLMAASILFEKKVVFKNIPLVNDVYTMKNLLIA